MAWNEKALKNIRVKTVQPDQFDLEAEAEGAAIGTLKRHEVGPHVLGKRYSREKRQLDGRRNTAEKRATDNLIEDTAGVYNRIVVPQRTLAQRPMTAA